MSKIYGVTVSDSSGQCLIAFCATLPKARLRSIIHRAQGYKVSRPAYMPKVTKYIDQQRLRGQIVAPALRDD